jgi:hypothetical protein
MALVRHDSCISDEIDAILQPLCLPEPTLQKSLTVA